MFSLNILRLFKFSNLCLGKKKTFICSVCQPLYKSLIHTCFVSKNFCKVIGLSGRQWETCRCSITLSPLVTYVYEQAVQCKSTKILFFYVWSLRLAIWFENRVCQQTLLSNLKQQQILCKTVMVSVKYSLCYTFISLRWSISNVLLGPGTYVDVLWHLPPLKHCCRPSTPPVGSAPSWRVGASMDLTCSSASCECLMRSGEFGGQVGMLSALSFSSSHSWRFFVVWCAALSCWWGRANATSECHSHEGVNLICSSV